MFIAPKGPSLRLTLGFCLAADLEFGAATFSESTIREGFRRCNCAMERSCWCKGSNLLADLCILDPCWQKTQSELRFCDMDARGRAADGVQELVSSPALGIYLSTFKVNAGK